MSYQSARLAGVVWLVAAAGASAQSLNFVANFDGTVNGQKLTASGDGTLDPTGQGNNSGQIDFGDLPDGFDPYAVDNLLTNICPNGFRADGGTQNLWDLAGGSYGIERTFQWIGLPGSIITADATVHFDEGTQTIISDMHLSGSYAGPTDLVGIDSYSVLWLPSSAEGEMFEAGTAVARRANGEQLIIQFATRYYGLGNDIVSPQTGIARFDTTFDGHRLTIGWNGYFRIAPAPGSASLLLGAGLFAGRRRR